MSNYISRFFIVFVFIISGQFALPLFVHAETHITDETVFGTSLTWLKEGSPYILDNDAFLPPQTDIYIGPGVTVESGPDAPHYLYMRATRTRIEGTADEPVVFNGLSDIELVTGSTTITHALINTQDEVGIYGGVTTISSSTFSGADTAIDAANATISISDSTITGNNYGIYSKHVSAGPVLSFIKKAMANTLQGVGIPVDDPQQNHISISSSTIMGNLTSDIYNETSNHVLAVHNWWGTDAGPGPNDTYGPVDVFPWITKNKKDTVPSICCSSVLFLPGVEASRLYRNEKGILGGIFGTSTNQLWEPNRNDDVRKLFMDTTGKSIDPTVYTKDIIDSVFGFKIYANFIAMMNSVVADGTITSWQAFPYDWRQSVDSIVSSPAQYATSTLRLVDTVMAMASSSKTGKVTIVAHSNGGLVAKMLVKTLQDQGNAGIVDKVILVAVPELGTPQAIAGLLHGDSQSIAGGLFLSSSVARQLGQNMPGAYGLLPSKSYFIGTSVSTSTPTPSLFGPLLSFAKSTLAGFDFSGYQKVQTQPQSASAYDALRGFLAGLLDHRPNPVATDILSPIVARVSMIDAAQHIHDALDNFIFPSSTPAISLVGWGKKTVDGVQYLERSLCGRPEIPGVLTPCSKALTYNATTTKMGDGTVAAASAASADSKDYYMNMQSSGADHATIFNQSAALTFVKDVITASSSIPLSTSPDPLLTIPDITNHFPTTADLVDNDLIVTIHSPVMLGIYDSQGRYTGEIANPDPTSDLGRYVVNIPGSDLMSNPGGEGYNIYVPYNDTYRVVLKGNGVGTFALDTEHEINGGTVATTTFADIPVTPMLTAELDLTPNTATSSQVLTLDNDGDGIIDATSSPHGALTLESDTASKNKSLRAYFQWMRGMIISLHLSPAKEKTTLAKIDKILDLLNRGKRIKADESARHAADSIPSGHWISKEINDTRRQALYGTFDTILNAMSEDK